MPGAGTQTHQEGKSSAKNLPSVSVPWDFLGFRILGFPEAYKSAIVTESGTVMGNIESQAYYKPHGGSTTFVFFVGVAPVAQKTP